MIEGWRDVTLGDFVALQRGHDLTEPERRPGNVPVMGSAGQNGFHDTTRAKGPGIVIGRSGASFGQVHFSPDDYWPHNTALYVTDFKGNDPKFAYYFLKAINFSRYNSGSAQPSLNRNFIYPIPVRIPPVVEQKSIAHILGTLDDKIELNRRMNATLEAMARALFQSWFVDFDPVKRNVEEGESRPEDALFPDSFEDSEMGGIPKGWTIKSLDEVADYQNGLALQKFRPAENEQPLPIVKIAQLKSGAATWDEVASPSINPACIIDTGDVVFSWSGSLVVTVWCGGRAALNQHLFKVTSQKYPKWFYLHWTQRHLADFQRIAEDKAVTMGHIKRSHLSEAMCVVPDAQALQEGTRRITPLIEQMISLETQSRTLSVLRDTLLPKLLSGEMNF